MLKILYISGLILVLAISGCEDMKMDKKVAQQITPVQ